jgi:DNA-binding transcriptional regulator YiaG
MKPMSPAEIKALRRTLGLTAKQLAERLNVSHVTVRKWECGLRQCRGAAVVALRQLAQPELAAS